MTRLQLYAWKSLKSPPLNDVRTERNLPSQGEPAQLFTSSRRGFASGKYRQYDLGGGIEKAFGIPIGLAQHFEDIGQRQRFRFLDEGLVPRSANGQKSVRRRRPQKRLATQQFNPTDQRGLPTYNVSEWW